MATGRFLKCVIGMFMLTPKHSQVRDVEFNDVKLMFSVEVHLFVCNELSKSISVSLRDFVLLMHDVFLVFPSICM